MKITETERGKEKKGQTSEKEKRRRENKTVRRGRNRGRRKGGKTVEKKQQLAMLDFELLAIVLADLGYK